MNPPELPDDDASCKGTRDWPHAPPHRLGAAGVYFVTVRTLEKQRHFHSPERLTWVCDHLRELAAHYGWRMEAWALMNNHYHLVAHSPSGEKDAASLRRWLKHFHADVSRHINRLDGVMGRQLWHNFRETHLTFQRSYLARLHYTHYNPVHHRVVARASDYPWCSAREFEKAVSPAWVQTITSFEYDEIAGEDGDE